VLRLKGFDNIYCEKEVLDYQGKEDFGERLDYVMNNDEEYEDVIREVDLNDYSQEKEERDI